MSLEGVKLGVDPTGDVLDMIWSVGLPQQQMIWAMMGDLVFSEEMRVARCDDRFASQQTGVAMVWMQAISLPRIVTKHHIGAQFAYHAGDASTRRQVAVEFAVNVFEEYDLAGVRSGQPFGGGSLFMLATIGQRTWVGVCIPGALRSVRADQVMYEAAAGGPFGERCPAAELDVVGVGADCERHPRSRQVLAERSSIERQCRLSRFVGAHGTAISPRIGRSSAATLG